MFNGAGFLDFRISAKAFFTWRLESFGNFPSFKQNFKKSILVDEKLIQRFGSSSFPYHCSRFLILENVSWMENKPFQSGIHGTKPTDQNRSEFSSQNRCSKSLEITWWHDDAKILKSSLIQFVLSRAIIWTLWIIENSRFWNCEKELSLEKKSKAGNSRTDLWSRCYLFTFVHLVWLFTNNREFSRFFIFIKPEL